MKKGLLVVVSGPSGCGKGTVNAKLLETGEFVFSVSATTRAPRAGEQDGVNYYFISKQEFLRRIEANEMLEYTQYCDNYYGTPLREAVSVLDSGKNLLLEIEVEGAMNVKAKYPDAILILLLPPNAATQEMRLRGRCSEAEEVIKKRLEQTRKEAERFGDYDYVVYNYDNRVEDAVNDILNIVHTEQRRVSRLPDLAANFFANN